MTFDCKYPNELISISEGEITSLYISS